MRKPGTTIPELTDEELALEMIEVTCDEMQSLTRVFEMLTEMCAELSEEIARESLSPASEKIH